MLGLFRSWKSADASMKDVVWDDYILDGQIDAIDTVRDLLGVPGVHAIGYCVAGTTLAATLALLTARGEADKVASATFFTAQVDFSKAGDLTQIGRAHVRTPVTNAHLVCRLLLEKKIRYTSRLYKHH